MRQEIERDAIDFVERLVSPPGGVQRRMQGVSMGGLRKVLEQSAPDALVLIAFMLPTGQTCYAPVRGLIDADDSGASVVLFDSYIEAELKKRQR